MDDHSWLLSSIKMRLALSEHFWRQFASAEDGGSRSKYITGGAGLQPRVRFAGVVELYVTAVSAARLAHTLLGMQVHLLVFDRAPRQLDGHVVNTLCRTSRCGCLGR